MKSLLAPFCDCNSDVISFSGLYTVNRARIKAQKEQTQNAIYYKTKQITLLLLL